LPVLVLQLCKGFPAGCAVCASLYAMLQVLRFTGAEQ